MSSSGMPSSKADVQFRLGGGFMPSGNDEPDIMKKLQLSSSSDALQPVYSRNIY
jgi:hypothetical protein